jgi:4-amino-4-deoxy-L-arabinose transferase-like glycosyltransferase
MDTPSSAISSLAAVHLTPRLYQIIPMIGVLLMLIAFSYPALARDLWTDEAFSATYTFRPTMAGLLEEVRKNEETPPLYFMSLWLWSRIVGQGEAALRSLSLIYGAVAILAFGSFARARLHPVEALGATLLMALAPLMHLYSIEMRSYTMAVLLTVLTMAAFERLYHNPERRVAQLIYATSAAVFLLSNYFSVAILGTHALIWLMLMRDPAQRWQRLRAGVAMVGLVLLCLLPWASGLSYQISVASAVTEKRELTPSVLGTLILTTAMGYPLREPLRLLWALPALAWWALAGLALLPLHQGDRGLIIRTLGLPLLILTLLMAVMQVTHPRYLITLLPGLCLAGAMGWRALHIRWSRIGIILLAIVASGMVMLRLLGPPIPATYVWQQVAGLVAQQAIPGEDAVLFHPPWDQRTFEYYYVGPALPLIGAHHYDDFFYLEGYQFPEAWSTSEAVEATQGYQRIWCLQDRRHYSRPPLQLPYRQLKVWHFGQIELKLYEVAAP